MHHPANAHIATIGFSMPDILWHYIADSPREREL
jgi:hypothetical protein